ncbi:MAG: PAS domain S-box protein, partial [Proteobacteria bacterium]|nr:PAS domain S-box protein [Pseudomonadota bacterium]
MATASSETAAMAAAPDPILSKDLQNSFRADELGEAFALFSRATENFSRTYEKLRSRVQELDLQLAETNAALKRNLAEKERVKHYLATTLSALPAGVVVVDESGRVTMINPAACEMLNVGIDQAVGLPLGRVLSRLDNTPALRGSLEGDFQLGRRVEIALEEEDGSRRDIEVVLLAASPEQRSAFGGVIVFHDITQLKRLEQRSATVSRLTAMGEMAMKVAHEVRNPLGSIELFASALARDLKDHPEKKRLAEHISAGVRSIESIVENILQFNRPRRLTPTRFELADSVRESLRYASHLLEQRQIKLRWTGDDANIEVSADRELLKQVFLNLAMNAALAMEKGGTLEIRIRETPQSVI